jgi:hypothetical protein
MSLNIFRTYTHILTKNIKVYDSLGNIIDITPFNEELNDMLYSVIDEHLQNDKLPNWCGYGGDIVAIGSQLIYTQEYTTIFKSDSDFLLNMDFSNLELTFILESFFDEYENIDIKKWSYKWGGELSMKTHINTEISGTYRIGIIYCTNRDAYLIDGLYYTNTITNKICMIMYNNYIKRKIKKIFTKDVDVSYVISSFLTIDENTLNV